MKTMMIKKTKTIKSFMALAVCLLPALVLAGGEVKSVTATGQAVIYGGDKTNARDKAIQDAQRKAVEQALGAMVSSSTVTENFQLISDKIFSKSAGYVRNYKVVGEKEDKGVYEVTISAKVSAGDLKNDVDGILTTLQAKNMPRILLMISEQNVNSDGSGGWWKAGTAVTSMDAIENTFIDEWTKKGIRFVDRQALSGKFSVSGAAGGTEPSADQIKTFAGDSGAEIVIIGKGIAKDNGTLMGTQMRSSQATMSIRALSLDTGNIIATSTTEGAGNHIDRVKAGTKALQKASRKAADDILGKMLSAWNQQINSGTTVSLKIKGIKKMGQVRKLMNLIKNQVRGVQDVRQRSYRKKVAKLEVEIKGSAEDLAIELEEKKMPGFTLEIDEITNNTISAVAK